MPDPADGPLHAVRPRGSQQDVLGCRGQDVRTSVALGGRALSAMRRY